MHRLVAAVALVVAGAVMTPVVSLAHAPAARRTVEIVRWVDGDTVETTAGTVRLIGIDTPERGQCGYTKATTRAKRLAPVGSRIRLTNPSSVDDTDKYG